MQTIEKRAEMDAEMGADPAADRTADQSADVVVVGGGVVGCAVAYFLASHARWQGRITVLEADPSYQRCATTRSLASIRHQFSTPLNIELSLFGTDFFRTAHQRLAVDGQGPDLAFREGGYLFLASAAGAATLRRNQQQQRALGAEVHLLEPDELARRWPWLDCEGVALGAFGASGEGWVDGHALLHGLRRKAQSLGVRFLARQALALERQGGRIVAVQLARRDRLACGWVVNAAGTGATALAASAGIALPVRARRRCVFHLRTPAALPGCPLIIEPGGVYLRPEGAGFLCGVAPPDAEDPDVEDLDDFGVDDSLWEQRLWPVLAARIPGLEAARVASAWAGHYDVNVVDHNAILGPHPDCDNLLFANGFSGHGLQQAPAVGRALAEWIVDGGWRSLDCSALGWSRVLEGRPLREDLVV